MIEWVKRRLGVTTEQTATCPVAGCGWARTRTNSQHFGPEFHLKQDLKDHYAEEHAERIGVDISISMEGTIVRTPKKKSLELFQADVERQVEAAFSDFDSPSVEVSAETLTPPDCDLDEMLAQLDDAKDT